MKEPKVLVISNNPFSDINNNGKTLKSIFSSFSRESLSQFYIMPQENEKCDPYFASSYYAVSEFDILQKILHPSRRCGGVQSFIKGDDSRVSGNRWYKKLKASPIRNFKPLRSLLWKFRLWNTKEFKQWYHTISPDIVFALVGAPDITYDISIQICKDLSIPLVIYFTDDYLIHPLRKGIFSSFRFKREKAVYERIVNFASMRYCIGKMMCEEYSLFFNCDFSPIMNLADIRPLSEYVTHDVPIISYFGSMSLNRWKMISRFSNLVGEKGIINIYTGDQLSKCMTNALAKDNVRLCGLVKGELFEEKKRESDILLHVESDEPEQRARTALSISTKIPDYLITGRLVIGFGPTEVASMRLISDNDIGIVLSASDDNNKLSIQLTTLLNDKNKWLEYGQKAYQYAIDNFDKRKTSLAIKNQLMQLVS